MATQTPMESAVDLFSELRKDVKDMSATLTEIAGQFKFWLPKWEQQTHGIITLENEMAALRNQMEKHKETTASTIERLRAEIAAKETAEAKLEQLAEQGRKQREEYEETAKKEREEARKERRDTFRWVVGIAIGAGGLAITLLVFLIQHVALK